MKNLFGVLICFTVLQQNLLAQDSLQYRVIFIGDAGEISVAQNSTIANAAGMIRPGKTSVFYLGDNIYPRGMSLPGSKTAELTKNILRSQYEPMRKAGAPVYFIPGNHDWDKSGPQGLEKIKYQSQFLQEQADSLLRMIPANGCPDPVAINLTENLVVIAYDSEWWLYPFNKENTGSDCECKTKRDVLAKLTELRFRNSDKIILLASHHPLKTYGVHGGKYTWRDHLFPLTAVNENLYIPLPVIGSIYPGYRSAFPNPEDLNHPLYKDMRSRITDVFKGFENMAYVAGHEHGLQLIKQEQLQVVSGSGAKHTPVKMGDGSLFANNEQGFVVADMRLDNSMLFSFYVNGKNGAEKIFSYEMPVALIDKSEALASKIITTDSIVVSVRPDYDKKGKFHRFLFGENYRKEWAAPTTLPVIRISEIHGGLKPTQLGGGMQSKSLRLEDKNGKEWVIRSVEKVPDGLLPGTLRNTFARDWLDDVTSAQHPFSALIVPPIANAVHVPHANPVIGVVSPDKNLGVYGSIFDRMVVLLEEREPLGESDNSMKLKGYLLKDNDNMLQGTEMQNAKMLDVLIGDWDRHEDQWRWFDTKKGKEKKYLAVPRDRDQVFHLTQGILPTIASQPSILPTLRNFDKGLRKIKWLVFKTKFVNAYPSMQFSREEWKTQAGEFKAAVTDSVLEVALRRLPASSYNLRHDELFSKLQARRDRLPEAMDEYYRFIQKIADVHLSNKNELVNVSDAEGGSLNVQVFKVNKNEKVKDELMNKTFEASLTKEIRIYLGDGKDSVFIDNKNSKIKIRIIGGHDEKMYRVENANRKIQVYDRQNGSQIFDNTNRLKLRISNDSMHTAFTPVNLYNITTPAFAVGLNQDDGFVLGLGFKYVKQEGFHRSPYATMHQMMIKHSFSTSAFNIKYNAEWMNVIGKKDITIFAAANAPNNTLNFFGRGNESVFNKTGDFKRFYRTRFNTYVFDAAIRSRGDKGTAFSIGPSLYYYRFEADDNAGRFINNTSLIGSYDSITIIKNKLHLGVVARYINDRRNNKVVPQWGSYVNIKVQAYKGLGDFSSDFVQIIPEVALYKSLNAKSTIILAERFGGTIGIGKTAFYQSAFIGGHENLLGYRQYRFAGQHSFYNNLELRVKLADIANYILPGQFGITGFWDCGRVWEKNDNSRKWHNGVGAGIYFAPASMIAFNLVMGYSNEGWLPYFTMGFRF